MVLRKGAEDNRVEGAGLLLKGYHILEGVAVPGLDDLLHALATGTAWAASNQYTSWLQLSAAKLHVTCCQAPQMLWHCSSAVLPQKGWRLPLHGAFEIFNIKHWPQWILACTNNAEVPSVWNGTALTMAILWESAKDGCGAQFAPVACRIQQRKNKHREKIIISRGSSLMPGGAALGTKK